MQYIWRSLEPTHGCVELSSCSPHSSAFFQLHTYHLLQFRTTSRAAKGLGLISLYLPLKFQVLSMRRFIYHNWQVTQSWEDKLCQRARYLKQGPLGTWVIGYAPSHIIFCPSSSIHISYLLEQFISSFLVLNLASEFLTTHTKPDKIWQFQLNLPIPTKSYDFSHNFTTSKQIHRFKQISQVQ